MACKARWARVIIPVPAAVLQSLAGTADGMWFIAPDTQTDRLTYDGPYQSQIMFTTYPAA